MEQGNRLDSVPVSAGYEVDGQSTGEGALDAAVTTLLQAPSLDDLPPPMPGEYHSNSPTPALFDLVGEWCRLEAEMNVYPMTEEELKPKIEHSNELHRQICAFRVRCFEDMRLKTTIYREEAREARSRAGCPQTMEERAWLSVVEDIEAFGDTLPIIGLGIFDPAFPAIEEGRRLLQAHLKAHETIKQDPTTLDPPQELKAAGELLWAHVDDVILKTVPRTGAGCRELARFAGEFANSEGIPISDDENAVTALIAQSALLNNATQIASVGSTSELAKAAADNVDLSGLNINDLCSLYEKLSAARALWGGALCEPRSVAATYSDSSVRHTPFGECADFEDSRAGFLMDRIVDAASKRIPASKSERDNLIALRVQHEIACEGCIRDAALLGDIARVWG